MGQLLIVGSVCREITAFELFMHRTMFASFRQGSSWRSHGRGPMRRSLGRRNGRSNALGVTWQSIVTTASFTRLIMLL